MATHHAAPGEIVNLATWADDLPEEHSKVIAKTDSVELARMVLPPGDAIENHHVDGPLVVHCVSGCLEIAAMGRQQEIGGGELLYLDPGETFTLRARRKAIVLLTFIFTGPRGGG